MLVKMHVKEKTAVRTRCKTGMKRWRKEKRKKEGTPLLN